ncbi:MAG: hypothetical protein K5917_05975 [Clostridiales bacterium]|nr:hypothetical protein [Clostridiales bacterium]
MESFIEYIEKSLPDQPGNKTLYNYKKQLLDKMTDRANEITHSGLKDEKVLNDLIISEFPDLNEDFNKYNIAETKESKRRHRIRNNIIGSFLYIISLIILYLSISFLTGAWKYTWLFILGGLIGYISYLLHFAIHKISSLRRIFHPFARILLAFIVMLVTTFIFLCYGMIFTWHNSWLIYILGVIGIYVADAAYSKITKQKLFIINCLIYIPAAMPMIYVLLGTLNIISWHPGWLLMPLSVLIDIFIILIRLLINSKYAYKQEVEDEWKAN